MNDDIKTTIKILNIIDSDVWISRRLKDETTDLTEIKHWCHEYCKDEWMSIGLRFYFKESKDVTFFVLKWC